MLIGRQVETAQLLDAVERGRPTLLVGPAGIGKTALLRAIAELTPLPVRRGGGLASLSWRSYLPLGWAIGDDELAGGPAEVLAAVAESVGDGLLILDDLHWADPETLALLPGLADRVRVLGALRTADSGTTPGVLQVASGAGFDMVEIKALGRDDSASLVRANRRDLDDEDVGRIVEASSGNALLLEELSASGAVPLTLQFALAARLRRCGERAQRAMATLGLLARPCRSAMLGDGGQELIEAGLVVEHSGVVEARHALLADSAVARLSADERRTIHVQIARAVDTPGEAARHYAAAGEVDDALRCALAAADDTPRPGEQARHLQLAVEQGGDVNVRLRASAALLAAGEHAAAEEMAASIATDDPLLKAEAFLQRARASCYRGDVAYINRMVDSGLELVAGTRTPVEARLRIERAWRAGGLEYDGDNAIALAQDAHTLAHELGVDKDRARSILRVAMMSTGKLEFGSEWDPVEAHDLDGKLTIDLGTVLATYLAGRGADAEKFAIEVGAQCKADLMFGWHVQFRAATAMVAFQRRGATEDYLRTCQDILSEPMLPRARAQIIARLGIAYADLGRPADAADVIERALRQSAEPTGRAHLLWARAENALHTGHPERAEAAARAVRELELGWHPVVLMTELAGCWARFDIDGDPRSPGLSPMFPALAGAGVEDEALDLMAQGSQTAVDRFAEAAETWADHDRRGELRCRWAAGEAARRVFDPRATALLTDIETRCAEAGLAGLLGRIRRSLRAAGVRPERASAKAGVLSARERQVLALVSQGLDSIAIAAQLGSARSTVESQLGSAMRKLGAHTRWEAATLLDSDRRDLDTSPR